MAAAVAEAAPFRPQAAAPRLLPIRRGHGNPATASVSLGAPSPVQSTSAAALTPRASAPCPLRKCPCCAPSPEPCQRLRGRLLLASFLPLSLGPGGGGGGGSGSGSGGGAAGAGAAFAAEPFPPPPGALGPPRLAALKDEPQTVPDVPSFGESPPLSPIDMDTQERIKAERKRLRNRIAASKCRKRKLERISRLEEKVKTLKSQNTELASTASLLREQVAQLKQKVLSHVNSGCQLLPQHQVPAY